MTIAEKYHVDLDHARNVAEVAVRLFDLFQADHGLSRGIGCCFAWRACCTRWAVS